MPVDVDCKVEGCEWERVERDAIAALAELGLADAELSVVLVDEDAIRALNHRWRGQDTATDVLSFPQDPAGPILGDVVISVPTALTQAGEHGHPVAHELRVLLVHGICHLTGHDHHEPAESARMAVAERGLLKALDHQGASLVERAQATR